MNNKNIKDVSGSGYASTGSTNPSKEAINKYTVKANSEHTHLYSLNITTPIYAGIMSGQKYHLWGSVYNNALPEQIKCGNEIDIKLEGSGNYNYSVYTHHGSKFVHCGTAEGGIYTVHFSKILSARYTDFMIIPDEECNGIATFDGNVTFVVDGTEYDFGTDTPKYVQLCQVVDGSNPQIPLIMGETNANTYYLCGIVDVDEFCKYYCIDKKHIKRLDLRFTGDLSAIYSTSQYYGIYVENGTKPFGEEEEEGGKVYEAVDGVYTIPISELLESGYEEFLIVSLSDGFVEFSNGFELDIYTDIDYDIDAPGKYVPYADDSDLQEFDIYFPQTDVPVDGYPAVVTIHGGGWSDDITGYFWDISNFSDEELDALKESLEPKISKTYFGPVGDYAAMHDFILKQGFAHININYRLLSKDKNNDNTDAPYQQMLNDIASAINCVEKRYPSLINIDKLVLMGYSAGAHLAMLYAYKTGDNRVKLVVSEAGPTDLSNYWDSKDDGGLIVKNLDSLLNELVANIDFQDASPVWHANASSPKTLLAYVDYYSDENGEEFKGDGVVPYRHATELQGELNKENCKLFTFSGTLHSAFQALNLDTEAQDYKKALADEFANIKNK